MEELKPPSNPPRPETLKGSVEFEHEDRGPWLIFKSSKIVSLPDGRKEKVNGVRVEFEDYCYATDDLSIADGIVNHPDLGIRFVCVNPEVLPDRLRQIVMDKQSVHERRVVDGKEKMVRVGTATGIPIRRPRKIRGTSTYVGRHNQVASRRDISNTRV